VLAFGSPTMTLLVAVAPRGASDDPPRQPMRRAPAQTRCPLLVRAGFRLRQ
jgi:hypothetical protein